MDETVALAAPAAASRRARLRRCRLPGVARSATIWLGRDAPGDHGDPARPADPGWALCACELCHADALRLARLALRRASLALSQGGARVVRCAVDRPHARACAARQRRVARPLLHTMGTRCRGDR